MSLLIANGTPPDVSANKAAVQKSAVLILSDNPIVSQDLVNSNRQSGEIRERTNPISKFGLAIDIGYTQTGATLNPYGLFNYIQSVRVLTDSQDVIFSAPGWMLPFIHQENNPQSAMPYATGLPLAASGTLSAVVQIPMDVGSYSTLLDASVFGTLTVEVTFGAKTDLFPSGTSTITSAKVTPRTTYIAGIQRGTRGGLGFPYYRQRIIAQMKPILLSQNEFEIDLLAPERVYHSLTLFVRNGAGVPALTDGLLTNLGLRRGGMWLGKLDEFHIKSRMSDAMAISSAPANTIGTSALSCLTGVYRYPMLTDPANVDQTQVTVRGETMQLLGDVTASGTNPHIWEVASYLTNK